MIHCIFENGKKASLRHVVVHGIVEKDGKLLLVKRAPHLLEGGKWSLPGGFLDRDETIFQCIKREVYEETGWECVIGKLIRINSSPNRPCEDRQNVSFDLLATAVKKTGKPDNESTEIAWFELSKLPDLDKLAFDHGESIKLYLEIRDKTMNYPVVL